MTIIKDGWNILMDQFTDLSLEGFELAKIAMHKINTDEPIWIIQEKPLADLMIKSQELAVEGDFEKLLDTTEGRNWLAYIRRRRLLEVPKKYIKKWARVCKAKKLGAARKKSDG